jgi:hypothetical protein
MAGTGPRGRGGGARRPCRGPRRGRCWGRTWRQRSEDSRREPAEEYWKVREGLDGGRQPPSPPFLSPRKRAGEKRALIQGWDWYAGSDPRQIGAGQYDFQTTLTHELGHALGLGESDDPTSAMYGTLAPATAIRTLTTADLNIPYDEAGPDPQRVAFAPTASPDYSMPASSTQAASLDAPQTAVRVPAPLSTSQASQPLTPLRPGWVAALAVVATGGTIDGAHDLSRLTSRVVLAGSATAPNTVSEPGLPLVAATAPTRAERPAATDDGDAMASAVAVSAAVPLACPKRFSPSAREPAAVSAAQSSHLLALPGQEGVLSSVALDAFFQAAQLWGDGPLNCSSANPFGADVLAHAWPILFALLGTAWGDRAAEVDSAKPQRPRQGLVKR